MITPVLLSGGSGTRLWPLSREDRPKQLLPLLGTETMLQTTARRCADRAVFDPLMVIAKETHADLVERQLSDAGSAVDTLILEPSPRNTAAAVALAALTAPEDALLLILPSDHVITGDAAFLSALERAAPLAKQGWIVTFGIRPDRPETGYGYIRQGKALSAEAFEAEAFVEKPDAATAQDYLDQGTYHWNAGLFLFSASTMIEALARHAPDIIDGVRVALRSASREGSRITPGAAEFGRVRSQSIDHAVMEHAERVAIVPVEMGWTDLGSWDALGDILEGDAAGNVLVGDAVGIDTRNCLIRSESRSVIAVGVENLVVVETGDAVLILPRGETQRTKEAVEWLRLHRPDLL